jgi:hypothetical protein
MKKSRLLEIIREEISATLNETGLFTLKNPADLKKGLPQTTDPDDTTEKSPDFLRKYKKVTEVELEEDQLNEAPIYDISDMEGFKSTLDKFKEEGVSKSKALNLLLTKLEDEGTVDTNALSKQYGVDTATFNNSEIRKFLNRPEGEFFTSKTGDELIDFTPYLSKTDKKRGKVAGEKPAEKSEPREKTALPTSGIKAKTAEPKMATEPKKASLTKGDDGFDKVSYSEPKAAEPKVVKAPKNIEGPSEKSLERGSGLADKKDELIGNLNKAKDEMKDLAKGLTGLKGKEYNDLVAKLKAKTAERDSIQKQIDKL